MMTDRVTPMADKLISDS
jgi:hypothetical protein